VTNFKAKLCSLILSLEEGAYVYLCSRTEEDVKSTISALASSTSGRASGAAVDVSKPAQVERWISKIVEQRKRLDVIVSNVSSISVTDTPEAWSTAFQVDMLGTVSLVNASLPHLEKTKGNIITISSVSGRDIDFTATSPYGAFKAALIHYTAQLAHTLAPKGVRANTVSPGNVYIADGVWGGIEKENPMGRMGKASEIANAVVFLASEKASFISGTNLVVDGSLCTGVQF
jgi:3-oxoacyl-[acyl-carrier protein] reductase